jgi:MFS family permease
MASSISESIAPTTGRRALALFTVLTAQFMLSMDLLIVVVALPRIQEDLGFNPAALTWVLNAFGLAFGGLLLLGGRLGDMMGQVRAFRLGLAVFVLQPFSAALRRALLFSWSRACCREWVPLWQDQASLHWSC